MRHILLSTIFLCLGSFSLAQDSDILLNHDLNHYMDRLDIRNRTGQTVHTDIKPYGRAYASTVFAAADTSKMRRNEKKWHRRMFLLASDSVADATQHKGYLWGYLYSNKRDFYHYSSKNFRIFVNPAYEMKAGGEYLSGGKTQFLSVNSRGIQVRGDLGRKIGFYTEAIENLMLVPQFAMYRVDTDSTYNFTDKEQKEIMNFPGETYVKRFTRRANSLDFFTARAYMTYKPIKQMRIKFGYDRGFWGNGYQSMLLSDNAANCLMLDINTRIWKLEYTNRYTQMVDFFKGKQDNMGTFPRKYGVFHQLSFKPNRNLSLSVFEATIYSPVQPNGTRGFELQYINPLIFYRSIEQAIGSADNGLIGFSGKYNFLNHFQLYGQYLIDEFRFSHVKDNILKYKKLPGSRYAKTAYQIGFKYIDVFNIPTLDMTVEFNNARPYMYQHLSNASSYSHYGQCLGYGWGGNARNLDVILNYHPLPQWNLEAMISKGVKGADKNNQNFGGDISQPYSYNFPRYTPADIGYFVGMGHKVNITQLYGRLSYQLLNTDMYLELEGRYRQENNFKSAGIMAGLRTNIAPRRMKY